MMIAPAQFHPLTARSLVGELEGVIRMMKQSLFGAAAIVVLASAAGAADMQPVLKAPAAVDQQATGYVEVYSGWARTESENYGYPERFNGWALGGAGRGNYWLNNNMSVQVDAQAEGTSYDSGSRCCGNFSTHSYLVGGHWSWRNPQQSLFGLFGGVGDAGGFGTFSDSQRHGLIGGEAQWYWHQFTLYAQVGYDTTLNTSDGLDSINAWFLRGTGRYFINPNFLIEGTVMYANGNVDFSRDPSIGFQTWTWGVKGEWRFATAPFSVFTKYQGSETTYDDVHSFLRDAKVTDHRVLFGLKLHMGDRTLQQTDRAGATLDIISPLANPTSPLMFDGRGAP
jgi:opacity protein-like surface antigen